MGIRLGIGGLKIGQSGGAAAVTPPFDWSSYWEHLNTAGKLDFRATGIESDGLTLTSPVGSGGALKQLPCISIDSTTSHLLAVGKCICDDAEAVFEYHLIYVIEDLQAGSTTDIIDTRKAGAFGFNFHREGATARGYYFSVTNGGGTWSALNKLSATYFNVGLNDVKININMTTRLITITVNGNIDSYTHTIDNFLQISTDSFMIGTTNAKMKLLYFTFKKDDVITDEIIFDNLYGPDGTYGKVYDCKNTTKKILESGSPPAFASISTQDLFNPYLNGYDLYWIEDTLKYQAVSPINSDGTSFNPNLWDDGSQDGAFTLFKRILSTELGYHILNYVEMPDLPIFDTTSRTYWKASIESDPYYVGGTAGRERWFHKTWLDFDWIDDNIEDAHKGLFYVQCQWKKAIGGEYVKTKVDNIVLLNEVQALLSTRNDIYESEDLGNFYQSFNTRSDDGIRHPIYAQLGPKCVTIDGNFLRYSGDGGHTYNVGVDFSTAYAVANISRIKITANGNICIFSNTTLVHYSDDNLETVTAASVVNADDSPYVFHIPANANYPGSYFALLNSFVETDDCIVIGNYANTSKGACPINLYYSIDNGITWKVFYTYGQNPLYTDDGTADGGAGGAAMGDAGNPIITTRVEGINIGYDGNVYVGTEGGTTAGVQCHSMMKCAYNSVTDTWTVTALLDATYATYSRMRVNGCYEKDGYIYWAPASITDFVVGGTTYHSTGIYKCAVADINDITKHILLSSPSAVLINNSLSFVNNPLNGKVLCNMSSEVHLSNDYGETWEIFDNKFNSNLVPVYCDASANEWIGYVHYKMKYIR